MKKFAFTMAEAILVMTILGIIATIMITTLKPAEYKDKGLAILAKKVLSEIDTATTQILINNSAYGTMDSLYEAGTSNTFSNTTPDASAKLAKLYKRYLTVTRKECEPDICPCYYHDLVKFYLKDGACVGITSGPVGTDSWIPGEKEKTPIHTSHGVIFFDINGEDEPNVLGKDQFSLPFGVDGIAYDMEKVECYTLFPFDASLGGACTKCTFTQCLERQMIK